jgi:hypothetical protein
MKETKNAENFSKYTFNVNENIINNNKNDSAYKNADKSNINYQINIKNEFSQKKLNENLGKDSTNIIVTNLFEPIKLINDEYFSNLKKINNTTYNPYFTNKNYKIKNYENLNQKRYYHKRFFESDILKSDTNNNINFSLNNNLKNIISINNSSETLIFRYKKGEKIKNDNEQIKTYDIGGRICEKNVLVKNSNIRNYLLSRVKYEKICENNSSNIKNQVKEMEKRIYNPHKKIRNQSMNGFIYNNKIKAYLNQLDNKKLQNNSEGINNSKIKRINYNIYLNEQNKFNKIRIDNKFN